MGHQRCDERICRLAESLLHRLAGPPITGLIAGVDAEDGVEIPGNRHGIATQLPTSDQTRWAASSQRPSRPGSRRARPGGRHASVPARRSAQSRPAPVRSACGSCEPGRGPASSSRRPAWHRWPCRSRPPPDQDDSAASARDPERTRATSSWDGLRSDDSGGSSPRSTASVRGSSWSSITNRQWALASAGSPSSAAVRNRPSRNAAEPGSRSSAWRKSAAASAGLPRWIWAQPRRTRFSTSPEPAADRQRRRPCDVLPVGRHLVRGGKLDGDRGILGIQLGQPIEMPGGRRALPASPSAGGPRADASARATGSMARASDRPGLSLRIRCPCACRARGRSRDFAAGLIDAPAGADLGLQDQRIDRAVVERQVPEPGRAVQSAGQDRAAVGAKRSRTRPSSGPGGRSGADSGSPVVASQTRAVPSWLHVASRRPSGLKSSESTWCR